MLSPLERLWWGAPRRGDRTTNQRPADPVNVIEHGGMNETRDDYLVDQPSDSRTTMTHTPPSLAPPSFAKYDINVVPFQPRSVRAFTGKRARSVSADNIYRLLDLSRYEGRGYQGFQQDRPEDFGRRMCMNVAAFVFVVVLAALAAVDVIKLDERQILSPAETVALSPMITTDSSSY